MCQRINKTDVANSFSRLTGTNLETSFFEISRIDRPQVVDNFGNIDLKEFKNRVDAKIGGISGIDVIGEASRLTGKSYENTFMEMNRIEIKPISNMSFNPLPPLSPFK